MRNLQRFSVFYSFITLLLLVSPARADEAQAWIVEAVHGDVNVRLVDSEATPGSRPVLAGTVLRSSFEIITGRTGQAQLKHGADSVTVKPNSVMVIEADLLAPQGVISHIRQQLGDALFAIEKIANRGFEVETPFLVSVVKGTTFTVRVGKQAAGVSLAEGRLLVLNGQREAGVMIDPGQTAYFDPGDKLMIVKDTAKLDAHFELLMSRVNIDSKGADGGATDVSNWSVMAVMKSSLFSFGDNPNVDTLQVSGVGDDAAPSVSLDSTADSVGSMLGALADLASGLALPGSDSLTGQLDLIGGLVSDLDIDHDLIPHEPAIPAIPGGPGVPAIPAIPPIL